MIGGINSKLFASPTDHSAADPELKIDSGATELSAFHISGSIAFTRPEPSLSSSCSTSAVSTSLLCRTGGCSIDSTVSLRLRIGCLYQRESPARPSLQRDTAVRSHLLFPILPSGTTTTDEGHAATKLSSSNCSWHVKNRLL
jgi:hypothetical protein